MKAILGVMQLAEFMHEGNNIGGQEPVAPAPPCSYSTKKLMGVYTAKFMNFLHVNQLTGQSHNIRLDFHSC